MSGIAGIVSRDDRPVEHAQIQRMTDALRHRGPDGEGFAAFCTTRGVPSPGLYAASGSPLLKAEAVIDFCMGCRLLCSMDQNRHEGRPITCTTDSIYLAMDGVLYNRSALCRELENCGHGSDDVSTNALIMQLFQQRGDAFLYDLDGLFSFALWDDSRKRLLLARDRLGAKPLYYMANDRFLAFASEIKAFISAGLVHAEMHPQVLAEYFTFQNTYGMRTLFKGIRILLPGTLLVLERNRLAERTWWEPQSRTKRLSVASLGECAARLREILRDTVEQQLVDDAPLGVFLSGGIDSGAIAAFAATHASRLHTFTCGFDMSNVKCADACVDERMNAERIASRYRSHHHERIIRSRDMARILPRLVGCLEELRLGVTYQNYYAAHLADRFVRVAMGGIGGDELFAGYPWKHGPALKCRSQDEFDCFCNQTYQRLVPESDWDQLFSPNMCRSIAGFSAWDAINDVFSNMGPADDFLNSALLFEIRTGLHSQLTNEDKIQMAFSTDFRIPLLGKELVDFALSVPSKMKLNQQTGKLIFRKAVEDLLPQDLVLAKKQGFCPPDRSWFRGPVLPYIRKIILSKRALDRNVFNQNYVERIIEEHVRGKADRRLLIWSFLCFEWWNRIWIDGDAVPAD